MIFHRSTKAVFAVLGLALLALIRERAYRRGLENGYQQNRAVRSPGPGGGGNPRGMETWDVEGLAHEAYS